MMKRLSSGLIASIGVSITFILVLLFTVHEGVFEASNDGLFTSFRYRCNITLTIQGDVSDLKDINRVTVFPNTTRQTVLFEEVKCVVNGVEVRGGLTVDDDGNAVLVFDIPQSSIRSGSVITMCFTVKIIQKATRHDFLVDELKRATLDEIPPDLVEDYLSNSSAWPISIEIYNLSHELAKSTNNIFDILSKFSRWIEENVAYPLDQRVKAVIGPQYPDETYQRRIGDCDDCSILFTTMCRAVGIPSFIQVGGLPLMLERKSIERYNGNYVYKSSGIAWHAWSMVYFPNIGWMPVDLTYFDYAEVEMVPGGLAYIRSPLGLVPRVVLSAYFKGNPIIYANITTLGYVDEARAWETAIADGRIRYVHTEELEILADRALIPVEGSLFLGIALLLAFLIVCLQLKKRRKNFDDKT